MGKMTPNTDPYGYSVGVTGAFHFYLLSNNRVLADFRTRKMSAKSTLKNIVQTIDKSAFSVSEQHSRFRPASYRQHHLSTLSAC
jgi:hypothetical protein